LAAKFYNRNADLVLSGADLCKEVITAYGRLNTPFLAPIKSYQPPTRGSGAVVATDYFPGGSLSAVFEEVAAGRAPQFWSIGEKVTVIGELIKGLKSLHDAKLFHGYLHPGNVLLAQDHSVCITDCVAWAFQKLELTDPQAAVSPRYVAPDMGRFYDDDFDLLNSTFIGRLQKDDIYSLGLIMFEILVGRPVYPTNLGPLQLMRMSRSAARPEFPASLVHDDFATLIRRAWDQKPEVRPTIDEFFQCFTDLKSAVCSGVGSAPCDPNPDSDEKTTAGDSRTFANSSGAETRSGTQIEP
jgi:serine/threonine protein kinase